MIDLRTGTYFELTGRELNALIAEHYSRPNFDVYNNEGVHYNTVLIFDVSDKLTRFEQTDIANFNAPQFVPNVTRALLINLCEKGLIPAGKYLIPSAM